MRAALLLCRGVAGTAAALLLGACGAPRPPAPSASSIHVYATSATATALPAVATPAVPAPRATATPPAPAPTAGPVVYTLDFTAERRDDVTLHVGQALRLNLVSGPSSDWISGVDDARVLRPVSADATGVYQAIVPGTALLTAHVPFGCARVVPARPCTNPEHGLWFQIRVHVVA